MAIIRKKPLARPARSVAAPAPGPKGMSLSPPGKGKPTAPKKPAEKPVAKTVVKPPTKAPKPAAPPKVLNKGALAAKEAAAKRAAEAAKVAAEKAEAFAKRPRKLVPATPNAIRPGATKQPPAKGKASQRPPAEVRPLGVLPPEAIAKSKPVVPGPRPTIPPVRSGAPAATPRPDAGKRAAKGDERLTEADLKHFEARLLEERARIMREMGHIENTILKVNARDSAGEVGGYSFHMADAGTDSMEREISFDIASKEGRLLREIDDALRRIYNGQYGICEASGKPIARVRLEALPWARYTLEEQANMEAKQRAGRLLKEEE